LSEDQLNNLLIGAVDKYSRAQVEPWMKSIRKAGYGGDIVLISYRIGDDIRECAEEYNVHIVQVSNDHLGRLINHNVKNRDTQSHQMRLFHAWQYLSEDETWRNYDYVLFTDVRDVYFQKNPFEW